SCSVLHGNTIGSKVNVGLAATEVFKLLVNVKVRVQDFFREGQGFVDHFARSSNATWDRFVKRSDHVNIKCHKGDWLEVLNYKIHPEFEEILNKADRPEKNVVQIMGFSRPFALLS